MAARVTHSATLHLPISMSYDHVMTIGESIFDHLSFDMQLTNFGSSLCLLVILSLQSFIHPFQCLPIVTTPLQHPGIRNSTTPIPQSKYRTTPRCAPLNSSMHNRKRPIYRPTPYTQTFRSHPIKIRGLS